ncbi:uncharacterized protein LOC127265424 [Andrographis paniculata]|uniref:uncharacterized protein LOC127265424 n=1 Tax=Andrographis paniculata TaxID=175694 RepID=UPI0021E93DDA|nr:uncharacterized protein LOC127265424 [Andrographis paniculata]
MSSWFPWSFRTSVSPLPVRQVSIFHLIFSETEKKILCKNPMTGFTRDLSAKYFLFLICLVCLSFQIASQDSLKPGERLNSSSLLVSSKGIFSLGFYTPDKTSNNTYLGVWYTTGSIYPVWIGNRESPFSKNSNPVLSIDSRGKLIIRNGRGEQIEIYSGGSSKNVAATLLNTGNLVIKDMDSNGEILWQSFDYPTDTLVPGMKLGINHKTRRNWTLTSWLGENNPAPGAFTLEWDPSSGKLLIRRRGMRYWTSGTMKDYVAKRPLSNDSWRVKEFENFNFKPDAFNYNYNFTNATSHDEEYFTYSLIQVSDMPDERRNVISVWRLNYAGSITEVESGRPFILAVASYCYGYNNQGSSIGCELWDQPTCRNSHQTFIFRSGYFKLANGRYAPAAEDRNSSLSLSDCRANCWEDCECVSYATQYTDGCLYWKGKDLEFEQRFDGSVVEKYVINPPSSERKDAGTNKYIVIIVVVVSAIALLLFGIGIGLFIVRKNIKEKREEELQELLTLEGYTENFELEKGATNNHDLKLFTYASIQFATGNFSSEQKLGQGGFGPVYKGTTVEGHDIAVKVLSQQSGQGLQEFKTELILISKLQHVNLVKLHGFCIHGSDKMIIYDYLPNKSLDFFLFDPCKKEQLDWPQRFRIIEGIAQGLLYLHKYSRLKIIHRDLKPSNILLDKDMNPKISDFGLARVFKQNIDEANTNRRAGTYGYMAPEYAMQGILSVKSDVYSFGVLVLEIVSGRKNNSFHQTKGPLNLVEYAWGLWETNSALDLMDQSLKSAGTADQLQRCIHIGLLCVENHPDDRPTIEDVLSMLKNETTNIPEPQNPAFFRRKRNHMVGDVEKTTPEKIPSANEVSISALGGRYPMTGIPRYSSFYTPDDNNTYLAVQYTTDTSYPVWIGNRESPIPNNSNPVLSIDSSGKLIIRHGRGEQIEIYSGGSSKNVSATLLNTGNLVMKDMDSNGEILWQSFDYPTDTLVPGTKLGVNHKTRRNWTLTSWLGPSNPAPGAFTLEWDPSSGRLLIKRRRMLYWTSGRMKDYNYQTPMTNNIWRVKEFENLNFWPGAINFNYNLTNVTSHGEEYFTYSLIQVPEQLDEETNRISGWRLNSDGDIFEIESKTRSFSLVLASDCYGYNNQGNDRGCELWDQPMCRNNRQTFTLRSGYFLSLMSTYDDNSSLSLSDCRDICWKDCECAAYGEVNVGCLYWKGKSLEFEQSLDGSAEKKYVLSSPSSKGLKKHIVIIVVVVSITVALLLLGIEKRKEELHELLTLDGYTENYELKNGAANNHDLRLFTYASIQSATRNFSSKHKLGQGGFGPVYKMLLLSYDRLGTTPEGQEIAVKVLSQQSEQGLQEFKTELILISKLQHVNLVKLHGFCIHGSDKMIIYDYLPNRSLDFFLFDPSKKAQLDWPQRFRIIEGIAQGLLYLHKYSRLKIIHRDLKPSNILLDKDMNPKISDFGLARIFKQNIDEANTDRRVGTYFGVLVLEIVSGRKNNSFHQIEGPLNLTWELWKTDSALDLMDPSLRASCVSDQLQRCIHVGLLCVKNHADDRPNIEDALSMTKNDTSNFPEPQNPAFITRKRNPVVEEVEKTKPEKTPSANEKFLLQINTNVLDFAWAYPLLRNPMTELPRDSSRKYFLYLICLCCLASQSAESQDTLNPGETFNLSSQLVSAKGNFSLGFYTPGENTTYLAVQYTADTSYPVWIGNRESPIPNNSNPILSIDSSGKLIIRHGRGEQIEIYSGGSSKNVSATLLNTGNLVIKDMDSNGEILWQSFDHPTDTLVPGMKLGVNHKTRRNWTLTSWLGENNPAPGAFTLEWDPSSGRLLIRQRGMLYWTSGMMKDYNVQSPITNNSWRVKEFANFNFQPEVFNYNYNFTNVTSHDEEYFTYSLIQVPDSPVEVRNRISGWRLNYAGDISEIESGRPFGLVMASTCYGYNNQGNDRGCELWDQPMCRNNRQTFTLRSGDFKPPRASSTYDGNSSLSLSDCRDICWKDCECAAYGEATVGCVYWKGKNLEFEQSLDGSAVNKYVLSSSSSGKKGLKKHIVIIVVVVSTVALLVLGIGLFIMQKNIKEKRKEELHELLTLDGYTENYELENGAANNHDLRLFTYASIQATTRNFSTEQKLGQGGFGPVYKGTTPEGQDIAVKVLSQQSGQGLQEFKTELILISRLQHVNLVKLHGFCIHGSDKMIIYDYLPNRSLDFFLFDPSKKEQLDWPLRFRIIEGIAQGLLYLHKYSRLRIIHRDLKPSNILLDKDMNPKISDFGLARIFKQNIDEANTNRRVGTYGYMAPEYAMQGILSVKSDVYSFGVLVLEIVSGRKNNSFHQSEGPLNLVEYAWELWKTDSALDLMDPSLRASCVADQLQRCIHIGLLCVENHADDRPNIEDALSMLKNDTSNFPDPQNPAFITRKRNPVVEEVERTATEKTSSANEVTISELGGR